MSRKAADVHEYVEAKALAGAEWPGKFIVAPAMRETECDELIAPQLALRAATWSRSCRYE